MNSLPQHKKSPEEIARIRQEMGLPDAPPFAEPLPAPIIEPRAPSEPKPVRSLRKSEQAPTHSPLPKPSPNLHRTELPAHRHADGELDQLRRAQAFEVQSPGSFLIAQTAHIAVVIAGYSLVFAAAAMPFLDWRWVNVPYLVPAVLAGVALIIAAFIFLKKKRSLHHAGFLTALAFLVIIFGALYYFPHLRNAP